ncbi:MAG: hypothetical protein IMHGJWDQ_000185 [Candidatus Fervidibacter sp.]
MVCQSWLSVMGMFSPLEADIMRILWERKSATVREVWWELKAQGKRLAYTTVMTVMVRLYEKGILNRVKEGKGYRYFPIQPRETVLQRFVNTVVDRLVAVFGEPAISYLAEVIRRHQRR